MALAILRFEGVEGDRARFSAALGRQPWYAYAIGRETTRSDGFELLDGPAVTSQLLGPVPPQRRGRAIIDVPLELFDRENRYMQLMSYRTEAREGPGVSDVVRVPVPSRGARQRLARESSLAPAAGKERRARTVHAPAPFSLAEANARTGYSSAMFINALVGMLPQLVPVIAPLVGSLVSGIFGGGSRGATTAAGAPTAAANPADAIGQLLQREDTQQLVVRLIQELAGAQQGGGAASSGAPAPAAVNAGSAVQAPSLHAALSAYAPRSRALDVPQLAIAQDGGIISGPVLAGLIATVLPSLMPMLQQALSPEMINTLLSHGSPERTIGPVTDAILKVGEFMADPRGKQFERLWQNTPQVGPSALPGLLMQMSMERESSRVPRYRREPRVSLVIEGAVPLKVNGAPRAAYRAGRDIVLHLSLRTPKPISRAVLHWEIQHPATLRSLAYGSTRVEQAGASDMAPVVIPARALDRLSASEEYMVTLSLLWRNRQGNRLGTSRTHLITIAGEYTFDRVEESGEPIPLADVSTHRDFWHKVWEGAFSRGRTSHRVECRYYYALEDRHHSTRMETQQRRATANGAQPLLRLRTGLLLSPDALNALLPSLSDEPPLQQDQLAALRSRDFRARVAQAALVTVTLRGRPGERCAIWVFPEVKVQRVILKRVSAVDEATGQVTDYTEVPVRFPVPALAHVIGVRTQR